LELTVAVYSSRNTVTQDGRDLLYRSRLLSAMHPKCVAKAPDCAASHTDSRLNQAENASGFIAMFAAGTPIAAATLVRTAAP
jgi:hypothetical protein